LKAALIAARHPLDIVTAILHFLMGLGLE